MAIVKVWPVFEISFSFICQDLTNDKKVKKKGSLNKCTKIYASLRNVS